MSGVGSSLLPTTYRHYTILNRTISPVICATAETDIKNINTLSPLSSSVSMGA